MTLHCIAFQIPPEHGSYAGHFPGNPIVPGALLLQWLLETVTEQLDDRQVIAVTSAKFSASLRPGDVCEFQFDFQPNSETLRVNCVVDNSLVCKAMLALEAC